jgi:hypothetical protein
MPSASSRKRVGSWRGLKRSIQYWARVVSDLKHERIRAIQPPLWPEEESGSENARGCGEEA